MGSVKDLITPSNASQYQDSLTHQQLATAVDQYQAAKPHEFGWGAWAVSGRFSVGDLKGAIPPQEITHKGPALAMMTGLYWEKAAEAGFESCYLGMLGPDGEVRSVDELLDRGDSSNVVVMKLANTPNAKTAEALQEYARAVQDGDLSVYVADAESIFRQGLPLGSSVFKRIAKATGRGVDYERVATYDDTVGLLDEIRAGVAEQGLDAFPELGSILEGLGIREIPNPGYALDEPKLNFTTKFALEGDVDITEEDAIVRMGAGEAGYRIWKGMVEQGAHHQINFAAGNAVENVDGKVEAVIANGAPLFTDFACTPDENRLMIRHAVGDITYLIPTNKEVQRAVFRQHGIYAAIDQAKEAHGETWLSHIFEYVGRETVERATHESIELMSKAITTVANRMLGRTVFDAPRLEDWIDDFLPFASRVQR